jgi:hypothetical protein
MALRALLAVGAVLALASTTTEDFRPIGSFDNVRSSRGEEPHCYGYSLELWRHNGRVIGLLDHHQGLLSIAAQAGPAAVNWRIASLRRDHGHVDVQCSHPDARVTGGD